MTTIGEVTHLLKSKDGDIGGILLKSGKIVDTPPGHGEALRAMLKKGDRVKVEGSETRNHRGEFHVNAKRIALTPRRASAEARNQELSEFEIFFDGRIGSFEVNEHGDVLGFRLEDGTVVITPVREGERIISQLQVGDDVHVEGHRAIRSQRGVKIVANRVRLERRTNKDGSSESIFDEHRESLFV